MNTAQTISNHDDTIDLRDVIARVEDLEGERDAIDADNAQDALTEFNASDEGQELAQLESFLGECCGRGGDEQWRGSWYPILAIRDSHFERYAEELAEDIGAIDASANWPNNCIDWERAARELQMDYTTAEFDGTTYWIR